MEDKVKSTIAEVFDEIAAGLATGSFGKRVRVGLTLMGSEHGEEEMLRGAEAAQSSDSSIEVVVIGSAHDTELELVEVATAEDGHAKMDEMLENGRLDAAVTMHYSFPIGVSTVGRVVTPGKGRSMYVANTTGTSDTDRASAMLKNTLAGIAAAKACGNPKPTVGILNIEGARQLERSLQKLKDNGYDICFTQSARADGGVVMRGNDLLQGVPDIMVMDSLTGNVVIKLMSSFTTGGSYEGLGDAYGPGLGEGYDRIINIISRASGGPVVAGALRYAGACARGKVLDKVNAEYKAAKKAGLTDILEGYAKAAEASKGGSEEVTAPPAKVTTEELTGVEILVLEDAVKLLWKKGIYATSGMGCTGPVIMVAGEDASAAEAALKEAEYL